MGSPGDTEWQQTQPTVRVVDYVAGSGGRPVTTDVSAALPAAGDARAVDGSDQYLPGSLGLAVGDFGNNGQLAG